MARSVGRIVNLAVLVLMLALAAIFALYMVDSERNLRVRDLTYEEFRRLLEYNRLEADAEHPLLLYSSSVEGRYLTSRGHTQAFRAFLPQDQRRPLKRLLEGRRLPYRERPGPGHLPDPVP
ncbi:MAG TPA: hypothetical protein VLV83_24240 [Acidobacteriota bacterium]|nr:hypothetical protein [Acidobacteriota bacterium]